MLHNQILSNKKTKKKLPWILISFGLFALFCIVSVFGYYGYIFSDFEINASPDHFGQFGDFIGGTLNPILAFLSFMALLYTIKIQTDELKLSREELEATREELKGSRIAQQEQSESLRLQNGATKLQMFENTFFKLMDFFAENKNNISTHIIGREDIHSYKAIQTLLSWYKSSYKSYDEFNNKHEKDTGVYFGQIYQTLKFIDNSNIENKQRYVNIFRAQFTKNELEFLFYHCLGTIGKKRFKKLVEDYAFFEHIILNKDIEKQLLEYDIKAFGQKDNILKKYNELKEKAKTEEIPAFVKAE